MNGAVFAVGGWIGWGRRRRSDSGSRRSRSETEKLRVLVVDRDRQNVELVERTLRKQFHVDGTTSAQEGLELLRRHVYDVIISDQRLPDMSGAEFLARSLTLAPSSTRIVISGYSDLDTIAEAVNAAGISSFLRKPFTARDLTTAVGNAAHLRQLSGPPSDQGPELGAAYRSLLENLPDGVALVRDGMITFANLPLAMSLGYDQAAEVQEQPLHRFLHPDDRDQLDRWQRWLYLRATAPTTVRLKKKDGTYAVFTVRARCLDDAEEPAMVLRLSEMPKAPALTPRGRCLIVDDDRRVRRGLERLLGSRYEVRSAESCNAALQLLYEDNRFDLVLADLLMPDWSGLELYRALEDVAPALKNRFYLMTGGLDLELPEPTDDVPPQVHKPFGLETVERLMEQVRSCAN